MSSDLVPFAIGRVVHYLERSQAGNTSRAYRADWRHFKAWCQEHQFQSMPASPETIMLYAGSLAEELKPSTIGRRLAAIAQAHRASSLASPTEHLGVRKVLAGIRREKGTRPQAKAPLLAAHFEPLIAALPAGSGGVRDRALLLLGFAGAFRRSELVALDWQDVNAGPNGLTVLIRRSKTDPEGAGMKKGIALGSNPLTCPTRALAAWRSCLGKAEGAVFRGIDRHGHISADRLSDRAVALIVKRAAGRIALDPAAFAGHSLRAGLATSAAIAGKSERAIMNQTGHRSVVTVRRYIRDGDLFRDNASDGIGL